MNHDRDAQFNIVCSSSQINALVCTTNITPPVFWDPHTMGGKQQLKIAKYIKTYVVSLRMKGGGAAATSSGLSVRL